MKLIYIVQEVSVKKTLQIMKVVPMRIVQKPN